MPNSTTFSCNGREYRTPAGPVVVACIDGFDPSYLEAASAEGRCPFLDRLTARYGLRTAASAMPSFTNPNNVSLITGVPPSRHGVAGNYALDTESGMPVMMNTPEFLRTGTILAAAHDAGSAVVAVTAKDKLRRLLGTSLPDGDDRAATLSVEALGNGRQEMTPEIRTAIGTPPPGIYSAEISLAVLRVGLVLLEAATPALVYLSTTDYMQHRYAPDAEESLDFIAALDRLLADIDRAGAVLVVTADHGMNAKTTSTGEPNVAYLQDVLETAMPGTGIQTILPITDPYVVHHGALGSCAMVYCDAGVSDHAVAVLEALPQVEQVLEREKAAEELKIPPDRIGDLVVLATADGVLGSSRAAHDLSALAGPLRSHGGRHEQAVPFIVNRPLRDSDLPTQLRNYDAFHVALNLLEPEAGHA